MDFKTILESSGGLWVYTKGRYLALLTSGKVSDVFCNTGVVIARPGILYEAMVELVEKASQLDIFQSTIVDSTHSLSVIGPGMGAITLAHEVAFILHDLWHLKNVTSFFTEPYETLDKDNKPQKLQKFRFDLPKSGQLLFVEDVITTGASVSKTVAAVTETLKSSSNVTIIPLVLCLVDRRAEKGPLTLILPNGETISTEVVSLLDLSPRTWDTWQDAKRELLSVEGALRPKQNWKALVEG